MTKPCVFQTLNTETEGIYPGGQFAIKYGF